MASGHPAGAPIVGVAPVPAARRALDRDQLTRGHGELGGAVVEARVRARSVVRDVVARYPAALATRVAAPDPHPLRDVLPRLHARALDERLPRAHDEWIGVLRAVGLDDLATPLLCCVCVWHCSLPSARVLRAQ